MSNRIMSYIGYSAVWPNSDDVYLCRLLKKYPRAEFELTQDNYEDVGLRLCCLTAVI